jgi:hypothetical protein
LLKPQGARHFRGLEQEMTEQLEIPGVGFGNARDGFPRNDQDVRRRLGINVLECQHLRVLVNQRRGNLLVGNLLEECFSHETIRD